MAAPVQNALFGAPASLKVAPTPPHSARPQQAPLPNDEIDTEADVLRAMESGTYHVSELTGAIVDAGITGRNGGHERRPYNNEEVFRHRVRSAISTLKRQNRATKYGGGWWAIEGTKQRPTRALIVVMGEPGDIELALGKAAEIARDINEPVDLIFCDPPWALEVGRGRDSRDDFDQYGRDRSLLVKGYQEVPEDMSYLQFSLEWIEPAAKLLRPGGTIAIVTDPMHSGDVQRAGMDCGLRFLNSLVAPRAGNVHPTSQRFATSHTRITVLGSGSARMRNRTFNILPETRRAMKNGAPFPTDVLPPIVPSLRRGRIRYPNQLPLELVDYLVRTYSNKGDLVTDFFGGSGTTPLVCLLRGRRCLSSDLNPEALKFQMARMLDVVNREQSMLDFGEGIGTFDQIQQLGNGLIVPAPGASRLGLR